MTIDGERLNHLLLAVNLAEANNMLKKFQTACQRVDLETNFSKIKIMTNLISIERIRMAQS